MLSSWKSVLGAALASAVLAASPALSAEPQTLRAALHSDLKIVDPIWTTAYITRNHGYMIYDTLFAMDEKGEIKPQMVERYTESPDKRTYQFTLRDGLLWHDGQPVTAEDVIASIKRWGAKDATGQKLMSFVEGMTADAPNTFTVKLKEPTGLLFLGLGKPSSAVPFMMPKRVAETDPNQQISDFTGSGPFVFKRDEWKPGDKAVYVKFDKYKPRAEPASGLAGGKVVKVDRVEWLAISDHQQAANALLAGEVDYIEQPPHDLLPLFKADPNVKLENPLANQYAFRSEPPAKALRQPEGAAGPLARLQPEGLLWTPSSAIPSTTGSARRCSRAALRFPPRRAWTGCSTPTAQKARDLLKEAGYDGTPIVLMHSTDLQVLTNLAPVAKSLMEKAGFKVDMQSMDWQTLVARRAKKDPANAGGWHAFLTNWVAGRRAQPGRRPRS